MMFGLGFTEIIVIVVAALIFIRPKDIPRVLAKLGRLYGQATRQVTEIRRLVADFEGEIHRATDFENLQEETDPEEPL